MTDLHDTIPAPPPTMQTMTVRAARVQAWGPVLLGVAAIIGAVGSFATGAVTVKTQDPGVRSELVLMRAEAAADRRDAADQRERVRKLDERLDYEAAERRRIAAELVYLQSFHPPK